MFTNLKDHKDMDERIIIYVINCVYVFDEIYFLKNR